MIGSIYDQLRGSIYGHPRDGQYVVSQERDNMWSAKRSKCGQPRGQSVVNQERVNIWSAKRGPLCSQPRGSIYGQPREGQYIVSQEGQYMVSQERASM